MNDEKFNKNIEELKKLYKERPEETIQEIEDTIAIMKGPEKYQALMQKRHAEEQIQGSSKILSDIDPKILIQALFGIAVFLVGLININVFPVYAAGCIFFLAGLMVGLHVKGFGIIFLFSHGMTGLFLMIGSLLGGGDPNDIFEFFNSPIMTDNPNNIIIYLVTALTLILIAVIYSILYNLSDNLKKKEKSLYFPLGLYFIGILMFVLFNKISMYLY